MLCLSKKRLSTVSYQASSSSSICFLLDGRYISRLSTFYFQGSIFANFLSFSFYPFFFFPHGCRRYMLCFIFISLKISISFVSKVFLTLSNLIHKNQQMSVAPLLWWLTIWSLSTNYLLQMLLLYSWTFFRKSARSHWLLRSHMKSNNELFPVKISMRKTAISMTLEGNSALYPPTENLSKNVLEGRTSTGTGVLSILKL